ncbi:MAG: YncE family protein [Gaiellales bacterium]
MDDRLTRRTLLGRGAAAGTVIALGGLTPAAFAAGTTRRLYVAVNGSMTIYDVPAFTVRRTVTLPYMDGPRGIACHPGIGSLWITHGSTASSGGRILRYDLATDTVLWNRNLAFGIDQLAVTLDGSRLYVPGGERSNTDLWHILDPLTGNLIGTAHGGLGAHNTVARTKHVYLAGLRSKLVYLDNGFTIGPLRNGCRPFTVDAAEQLIYTTSSQFRGFQVASITTGTVMATVTFGKVPPGFTLTAPSHGISLSPDGSEVWVLDTPAQRLRVYSTGTSPAHLADVVINPITGVEQPPGTAKERRDGWLLHGRDGVHVYVGDSGSVISAATRKQIAVLDPLRNSRHGFLEVIFDSTGKPVDTSTHFGLSYLPAVRVVRAA